MAPISSTYELRRSSISETKTLVWTLSATLRQSDGPSNTSARIVCAVKTHTVVECTSSALLVSDWACLCCQHLNPSYARIIALQYQGSVYKQNMLSMSYKQHSDDNKKSVSKKITSKSEYKWHPGTTRYFVKCLLNH